VGGALGLAIFSGIATSRTAHLLAGHAGRPDALTSGFQRALTASSLFLLAAAFIALRIANTRGEAEPPTAEKSAAAESVPLPAREAALEDAA
jgi:hypothetical protein